MCISPCSLPEIGLVACRYCWQCKQNRINDYVGRCIAEQENSTYAVAVTLTYAGDSPNAATLVYKDVQDFMKRLRKKYDARYIVVGEYGSKKGRAHWHAVLFFQGDYPDVEFEKRENWKFWPQGYSYFQRPEYEGFKYLLKYALKDLDQDVYVGHLAMSKKPPLGTAYFLQLAERYVQQSLSPQDPFYSFPHIFDKDGKRRKFMMRGRVRELFIEAYLDSFEQVHGREYPYSEFILEYEDSQIDLEGNWTDEEIMMRLADKPMSSELPVKADETQSDLNKRTKILEGTYRGIEMVLHCYPDGTLALFYENAKEEFIIWRENRTVVVARVLDGFKVADRSTVHDELEQMWYSDGASSRSK